MNESKETNGIYSDSLFFGLKVVKRGENRDI